MGSYNVVLVICRGCKMGSFWSRENEIFT